VPVTTRFRELIDRPEILPAMGGYDALSARLIERAGGEVVYMSGSSVSTSVHGYPDVGLTTMTEMVDRARGMASAVDVPVFCDVDTGYGNPINVMRTVEEYERAGVAGIHIEDQTFPKKCGHFEGKDVVPTDARAVEGFERAVERAEAYLDAGADALFVEAPTTREELERVGEAFPDAPLVANRPRGARRRCSPRPSSRRWATTSSSTPRRGSRPRRRPWRSSTPRSPKRGHSAG
jgi:2-methylisocitrate lyase-like PEP mutase family enzyme